MVLPRLISGSTIASTWEDSIRYLLSLRDSEVVDTDTGGATIEAECLLMHVAQPLAEPRISDRYVDPQLITGYQGLFTRPRDRGPQEAHTIADRIYAWPASSAKVNQVRRVVAELKSNPSSRRAIIQIWNPEFDLPTKATSTPSGHCSLQFSIRSSALNLVVESRSIDAWNGQLPNMLALVNFQRDVAHRLSMPVGEYAHFIVSYHIYLRDIPSAASVLGTLS